MPMEESHIWLGYFPSQKAIDDYFVEKYKKIRRESPINKFAKDQGVSFYDHDWLEYSYNNSGDLNSLIYRHSYSKDYIDKVIKKARNMGISNANVFIMIDKEEISHPKSIDGDGYSLWYLGLFNCNI